MKETREQCLPMLNGWSDLTTEFTMKKHEIYKTLKYNNIDNVGVNESDHETDCAKQLDHSCIISAVRCHRDQCP